MLVNISRSKFLINSLTIPRKARNRGQVARCNHCGGAFRNNGDLATCIMCSRETGHACASCSHTNNADVVKS
jgi:hypothetical protein